MRQKIRYRLVYNYCGKINADGRAPIAVEARQGAKKVYFSSKVLVYPDQWFKGSVINHDNSDKLTVYLHRWMHQIEEIELDALLHNKDMTLSQLKNAVKSGTRASATLSEFVCAVIDPSTRSSQTKSAYHTLAREAERYDKGVTIESISHDWIERWRAVMKEEGLSDNTIKGRLKELHCLTQEAIKRDLITDDPFKWITIGNMTAKKEFLTMNEMKKIEKVKLEGKEAAVRDLFMLGCWSGLRWSDLSTLEEAEISKGVLRKRMYKTNLDVTIPIATLFWGKGQEIIDRYQPITKLSHCVKCNSTANRIIKSIAERVGINKSVHFHLARKSCSSNLYQMGLPMQEVSMILGHSKMETTQKYYIFGKEHSLIKASKKLFKEKSDQGQEPPP
jgi:site-specific recombinase XerD